MAFLAFLLLSRLTFAHIFRVRFFSWPMCLVVAELQKKLPCSYDYATLGGGVSVGVGDGDWGLHFEANHI